MIISRRAFLQITAMAGAVALAPLNLLSQPDFVEIADEHLIIPELNIWCSAADVINGPCLITSFIFCTDFREGIPDGLARFSMRRPRYPKSVYDITINKRCTYNWDARTSDAQFVVPADDKILVESPDPDMVHMVYYRRPGPDGQYIRGVSLAENDFDAAMHELSSALP